MKNDAEFRIAGLNSALPPVPKPIGVYKPVLIADKMIYVSGQIPINTDGTVIKGRLGEDMTLEDGKVAARQVGLTMLATIKNHIGDLNQIKRIIKVLGMVNCTADFGQHPAVINGFSELMAEVFGDENGIGVRSAIGAFLPMNIAVEVEAIFELY
jgi:enamine deaminase RidA (YjgF/YER057c/UK114 family)